MSVLIPSYNSYPYVSAAIQSALAQDDVDLEILVQDGGSTDGTREVLEAVFDDRVQVICEADTGQSDALNRALQRASGEFVIWLNADDLLTDASAAALLRVARAAELDVVHGDFEIVDAEGEVIKGYSSAPLDRARLLRHGTYIFSGALLVRRALLLEVGGFDASLHYCMDYDLLLRLAATGRPAGSVPRVVAQFRRQPASKSELAWFPFLREWLSIGKRHGASKIDTLLTVTRFTAYKALILVWRSRLWLRFRPHKRLGGRQSPSAET